MDTNTGAILAMATSSPFNPNSPYELDDLSKSKLYSCGYDEKTADGVLRLSFSPQTTEGEIDEAAKILNEIGQELSRRMK